MAWFSRTGKDDRDGDPGEDLAGAALAPEEVNGPSSRPLGDEDRARIARALEQLAADGVDLDDLVALGAAFDTALREHVARPDREDGDHDQLVERFGIGIGEHLTRHGRMDWAVVTDVFGTDLGLTARRRDFIVVPSNLVAARWINKETGWLPGVVGHLVMIGTTR